MTRISRHLKPGQQAPGNREGEADAGSGGFGTTVAARAQRIAEGYSLLRSVLVAFVMLVALSVFVGRLYVIPSGSMEPTLHGCEGCTNDRIAVQKLSYTFGQPHAGDVVVFAAPPSWNGQWSAQRSHNVVIRGAQNVLAGAGLIASTENILVKRVIATAGSVVKCEEGDPGVMVDGHAIASHFVLDPPAYPVDPARGSAACGGEYFGPVQVPADHVWVMGDNRTNSADSRAHLGDEHQGAVPVDNIRGKVAAVVFPPTRLGTVEHADL
ncbi:signal peptidase I [Corynebacterium lizhenjunii]|uniref:Signal peptidase I n=1 Tax=Corynebacterium lizhenjunii TaxID=2709394 RepID=A0A7T0KE30_9CORY|nr:signal peptidase I [Corynebacterium lizhenjunii]